MPDIGQWKKYVEQTQEVQARMSRAAQMATVPKVKDIAFKAQTVVDHPGWQFYLDSLETKVREIEKRRVATAERMVTGTEMGKDLELLKINLNAMDAEMAGLRFAQTLIPAAIEHGQQVVASVNVG